MRPLARHTSVDCEYRVRLCIAAHVSVSFRCRSYKRNVGRRRWIAAARLMRSCALKAQSKACVHVVYVVYVVYVAYVRTQAPL
eukprot:5451225-Pyramimonas_sp.AAC.1